MRSRTPSSKKVVWPSLLVDASAHESVEELVELAKDEQGWTAAVRELDSCGEEAGMVFDEGWYSMCVAAVRTRRQRCLYQPGQSWVQQS